MNFPQSKPMSHEAALLKAITTAEKTGESQIVYQVLIHDGGFDSSPLLPIYGEQVGERVYPPV
jgi:hypothetical protein